MCVVGASEENVTKYVINVLWRGLNQSRSSVNFVIDDSGVGEVWQCTDVGDESAINGPTVNPQVPIVCGVCGRQFRRSGDLKRHKCNEPQSDVVQCPTCQRWFKNTRCDILVFAPSIN